MKISKFLLAAGAVVVTLISFSSFRTHKKGAGTLKTVSGTRVPCVQVSLGLGQCVSNITYYTLNGTNIGHTAYNAD